MLSIKYNIYKKKILNGNFGLISKMKKENGKYALTKEQVIDLVSALYMIPEATESLNEMFSILNENVRSVLRLYIIFSRGNVISNFKNNKSFRTKLMNDIQEYRKQNNPRDEIDSNIDNLINELLNDKKLSLSYDLEDQRQIQQFILNFANIEQIKAENAFSILGRDAIEKVLEEEEQTKDAIYSEFFGDERITASSTEIEQAYEIYKNLRPDLKQMFLNNLSNRFVMKITSYYSFVGRNPNIANNLFLAYNSEKISQEDFNKLRYDEKSRELLYDALERYDFSQWQKQVELKNKEIELERVNEEMKKLWSNIITVEVAIDSSKIVYNKPNALQSQYYGVTAVPTRVYKHDKTKVGCDLDIVIMLLFEAAEKYNFNLDNKEKLNEYYNHNIFKSSKWESNKINLEEEKKIREDMVQEILKTYVLLYSYVMATNQEINYTYRDYHEDVYYDDTTEKTIIVTNVFETLKKSISNAILYTKGQEEANKFLTTIDSMNTSMDFSNNDQYSPKKR